MRISFLISRLTIRHKFGFETSQTSISYISVGLAIIGTIQKVNNIPEIVFQALQYSGINTNSMNVKLFIRLLKSNILFTPELYRRSKKNKLDVC